MGPVGINVNQKVMKTKLFTLFVALLATTNLWAKFQYGNLYYETLSSNTAKVVGYIGNPTSVSIPTLIQYSGKQYTVTSIGNYAFEDCSSLTSVTIPNSVTSIGDYAFSSCSGLTSAIIGNSVTSIGDYAFLYCSSLTSIEIPESVTSIGYAAFWNCSALTAITIPNSVTSIGDGAFSHCYSLFSVTIGNSVTSIEDDTFYYCFSLSSVTIGNSVTSIGYAAFYKCSSLTSVTIPNTVTSIGKRAFLGCSELKSMVVESGNTVYDSRENCNAIIKTATNTLIAGCNNTTIPNSVTSIGEYAFYDCSSLTSVTIPNSVTSIESMAFIGCSELKSMVVESGNTVYDSRENCNAIIKTATNTLIAGCKNTTIPNSVTSIGDNAFFDCSSLTSVTIPNSVTSIGKSAFWDCESLTTVICKAILVPSTGESVFANVPISSAVLYVPDESVDIYKYMDPWDRFGTILPISQLPTDVENVQTIGGMDPSKKKLIRDGQVVILHNDKSYNIMGQEIK